MENNQIIDVFKAEIMIVDDTLESLTLLSEIFVSEGYLIRSSNSGEQALLSIAKKQPDIILLDIKSSTLDGFELLRRLKSDEKMKDTPVLFISDSDGAKDKI
ncbi:MAG: response regulator, partial [Erysipelotrichaceae bacterium]|nr:response regulator [Erysipelotrichaceae bacterium]